jgi:hypothetical protein
LHVVLKPWTIDVYRIIWCHQITCTGVAVTIPMISHGRQPYVHKAYRNKLVFFSSFVRMLYALKYKKLCNCKKNWVACNPLYDD